MAQAFVMTTLEPWVGDRRTLWVVLADTPDLALETARTDDAGPTTPLPRRPGAPTEHRTVLPTGICCTGMSEQCRPPNVDARWIQVRTQPGSVRPS
jgi:hypothetical protein